MVGSAASITPRCPVNDFQMVGQGQRQLGTQVTYVPVGFMGVLVSESHCFGTGLPARAAMAGTTTPWVGRAPSSAAAGIDVNNVPALEKQRVAIGDTSIRHRPHITFPALSHRADTTLHPLAAEYRCHGGRACFVHMSDGSTKRVDP